MFTMAPLWPFIGSERVRTPYSCIDGLWNEKLATSLKGALSVGDMELDLMHMATCS